MKVKEILNKKFINRRSIHILNFFKKLKKKFIKGSQLDQCVLTNIGRGRWLLASFYLQKNKLEVFSPCSENFILSLLYKYLPNEEEFWVYLHIDFQFWNESNKGKKSGKIMLADLKNIIKMESKILPNNDELNTFEIKSSSLLDKKNLLKFLHKLFKHLYSKRPYIILKLKSKSINLNIILEDNDLRIEGNNMNKDFLLNFLNSMFLSECKLIPSYCIWYVDIEEIKGDWKTGKRTGYLIQEYGNEKHYTKQYKI